MASCRALQGTLYEQNVGSHHAEKTRIAPQDMEASLPQQCKMLAGLGSDGGWIVFISQMAAPEFAVLRLGVSVWQLQATASVITEFTPAQMYCNRPQFHWADLSGASGNVISQCVTFRSDLMWRSVTSDSVQDQL